MGCQQKGLSELTHSQRPSRGPWEQYDQPEERHDDASREETAHRVAWAAVKQSYEKDETTGKWQRKREAHTA